jgi:hypothetical protein
MTANDDSKLDPIDERAVPLVLAIGRLVLGAAALEKVLLVDIVMRPRPLLDASWPPPLAIAPR